MASGIIGQVYKAKLKNIEEEVIIKVRHPHIMNDLQNGKNALLLIKLM